MGLTMCGCLRLRACLNRNTHARMQYIFAGNNPNPGDSNCGTKVSMWQYDNTLLATTLTGYIGETYGNYDFAFFGEAYNEDPFTLMDQRLSAGLVDSPDTYRHVWYSVYSENAADNGFNGSLEDAFTCYFCVDGAQLACVRAQRSDEYNGWCSSLWMRQWLGYKDENCKPDDPRNPEVNAMTYIILMAGGYIPDITFNGGVDLGSENQYWWAGPWEGQDAGYVDSFVSQIEGLRAFNTLALRAPMYTTDDSAYRLMRYDAFGNGDAAFATFNLKDEEQVVYFYDYDRELLEAVNANWGSFDFDPESGLPPDPIGAYWYQVDYGYALPAWDDYGSVNCYEGAGSTYNPDPDGVPDTNLAVCLLLCLGDSMCEGVTVIYSTDPFSDATVTCFKRGGIDISACDSGDTSYGTFLIRQ